MLVIFIRLLEKPHIVIGCSTEIFTANYWAVTQTDNRHFLLRNERNFTWNSIAEQKYKQTKILFIT